MKYSQTDLDLDAIAASVKLRLTDGERQSFATDVCDMLNYCYEHLSPESADGTLELCLRKSKTLGELREDIPIQCDNIPEILANAPARRGDMIAVPKAIGSEGGDE